MKSKPEVKLVGTDGNAFAIIAKCHRAAQLAGWSAAEWDAVKKEMMSGDYDNLLRVAMAHFEAS